MAMVGHDMTQDDDYDNLLYGSRVMATGVYDKAA